MFETRSILAFSDLERQANLRLRLISSQLQSAVQVCSSGLQTSEATKSS